jgi:hypothetical protein
MSSHVTTQQLEAANALLLLSRSAKPLVNRYYLRDRSKINQPKVPIQIYYPDYSKKIVQPAPKPVVASTRQLRDRIQLKQPDRLLYSEE